jgi:glycosyltransferase involved in cell wall biosynthesis
LGRLGVFGSLVERLCARLGSTHLCISPTTARRLKDLLRVNGSAIHVIPRGLTLPADLPAAPEKEPLKVVMAGRLAHNKRADLVLRAWPRVLAELPGAVLHVIGDGPERAACEQLADRLGIGDAVRFRGQIPGWQDVLREIASASLLVQPSSREGQSLVVIESMALGTAVLAATGPETAVADFLTGADGEHAGNGRGSRKAETERSLAADPSLLPLEAGPEPWAKRIVELLRDRPLLVHLAERGRNLVRDLDWSRSVAPRMEALYRSLARANRLARSRSRATTVSNDEIAAGVRRVPRPTGLGEHAASHQPSRRSRHEAQA